MDVKKLKVGSENSLSRLYIKWKASAGDKKGKRLVYYSVDWPHPTSKTIQRKIGHRNFFKMLHTRFKDLWDYALLYDNAKHKTANPDLVFLPTRYPITYSEWIRSKKTKAKSGSTVLRLYVVFHKWHNHQADQAHHYKHTGYCNLILSDNGLQQGNHEVDRGYAAERLLLIRLPAYLEQFEQKFGIKLQIDSLKFQTPKRFTLAKLNNRSQFVEFCSPTFQKECENYGLISHSDFT